KGGPAGRRDARPPPGPTRPRWRAAHAEPPGTAPGPVSWIGTREKTRDCPRRAAWPRPAAPRGGARRSAGYSSRGSRGRAFWRSVSGIDLEDVALGHALFGRRLD